MRILIDPHFSKRDISMYLQYWSESDGLNMNDRKYCFSGNKMLWSILISWYEMEYGIIY